MSEFGFFQEVPGHVIKMDLPLSEVMKDKVTKGYLKRVNEDGSSLDESAKTEEPADEGSDLTEGVSPRPAVNAPKADWVGYAVAQGMLPDDAEAMTKHDLIDKFGK